MIQRNPSAFLLAALCLTMASQISSQRPGRSHSNRPAASPQARPAPNRPSPQPAARPSPVRQAPAHRPSAQPQIAPRRMDPIPRQRVDPIPRQRIDPIPRSPATTYGSSSPVQRSLSSRYANNTQARPNQVNGFVRYDTSPRHAPQVTEPTIRSNSARSDRFANHSGGSSSTGIESRTTEYSSNAREYPGTRVPVRLKFVTRSNEIGQRPHADGGPGSQPENNITGGQPSPGDLRQMYRRFDGADSPRSLSASQVHRRSGLLQSRYSNRYSNRLANDIGSAGASPSTPSGRIARTTTSARVSDGPTLRPRALGQRYGIGGSGGDAARLTGHIVSGTTRSNSQGLSLHGGSGSHSYGRRHHRNHWYFGLGFYNGYSDCYYNYPSLYLGYYGRRFGIGFGWRSHCYGWSHYYRPYCVGWYSPIFYPGYDACDYWTPGVLVSLDTVLDYRRDDGSVAAEPVAPAADRGDEKPSVASVIAGHVRLGDLYFKDGRYQDAAESYLRALAYAPDDATLHFVLADALFAVGDYHYAAFVIQKALRLDPALASADADKRSFYGDPEKFTQHMATLLAYLKDKPYDTAAHLVLGYNLRFSAQFEPARAAFHRVLELQPDHASAKAFLAALNAKTKHEADGKAESRPSAEKPH